MGGITIGDNVLIGPKANLVSENHPKEDFTEVDYVFLDFKDLKLEDLISLF